MPKGRKNEKVVMSKGLTLIEVLAVLVIIGVMIAIAVPNLKSPLVKTNEQAEDINLQMLQGAVRQFKLDTGISPADLSYLTKNPGTGIPGWSGPYIVSIPLSPLGKTYDLESGTGKVIAR